MHLIVEVLRLLGAVFGTASAVQTINKSPPYWHLDPIKEKQLRESFQNDWPIIALPLVYQIVSEHISHSVYSILRYVKNRCLPKRVPFPG